MENLSPSIPFNHKLASSTEHFTHSRRKIIDHIVYHTESMTGMAKKIMACSGAEDFMTLGKISWGR